MNERNLKAYIWLSAATSMPPSKKCDVLALYETAGDLYGRFVSDRGNIVSVIGEASYEKLNGLREADVAAAILEDCDRKNILPVTKCDGEYPQALGAIYDPPAVLYCRGDAALLKSDCFAIVGSRKIGTYGKDVTKKFAAELAHNGFTIVSGLARGVDTYAHVTALECNAKTIAVLGCGADIAYPAENRELALRISQNGLIVTEYPPTTKPLGYHFPQRNRIISGLSQGVLIPEAGRNSGSMITANVAAEQHIPVFAVPGNIFSDNCTGTNDLIKNNSSVTMVTEINDIFEKFGRKSKLVAQTAIQLDFFEQCILNELEAGEAHFEELLQKSNLEVGKLLSVLTGLELSGFIRKLPGNFYAAVQR